MTHDRDDTPASRSRRVSSHVASKHHGVSANRISVVTDPLVRSIQKEAVMIALRRTALAFAVAAIALGPAGKSARADEATKAAIEQQLNSYEQALNKSDVDAVMKLYAKDAVFMPQGSLPIVGRDAIRSSYEQIFKTIKLNVVFKIDEVRQLAADWAFARTRSNGTVKVLASDRAPGPEANQELFLFHREDGGQWRFARYIFATTNPPR